MINVLKMIVEVKSRPWLWDTGHEDYTNREKKKASWENVTSSVLPEFDSSPSHKWKKQQVELIHRKWKSVSDYYKKEKKAFNEGVDKKKYVFSDALTFLDPFIKYDGKIPVGFRHKIPQNYIDDSSENDFNENLNMDDTIIGEQSNEVEAIITDCPPLELNKKRKTQNRADPLAAEEQYHNMSNQFETLNEDPDALFLLSFLPDIKALSEEHKLDFKIQMLKTLKQLRYSGQMGSVKEVNAKRMTIKRMKREVNIDHIQTYSEDDDDD